MKLSEMKYSEQMTISFALLLFLVFPWLCRNVDITSTPIDPGILSAPLLAVLSFLLFKGVTWWCMKMIWPVFAEYSMVYFEADFKILNAREKVLIYLGFYILIVMGFVVTLGAIL